MHLSFPVCSISRDMVFGIVLTWQQCPLSEKTIWSLLKCKHATRPANIYTEVEWSSLIILKTLFHQNNYYYFMTLKRIVPFFLFVQTNGVYVRSNLIPGLTYDWLMKKRFAGFLFNVFAFRILNDLNPIKVNRTPLDHNKIITKIYDILSPCQDWNMVPCYATSPINFCRCSCYSCAQCVIITVDQNNPYIKMILV